MGLRLSRRYRNSALPRTFRDLVIAHRVLRAILRKFTLACDDSIVFQQDSRFRGEENRGRRSSTRPTGPGMHADGAAVFVDDLFGDPESEPFHKAE